MTEGSGNYSSWKILICLSCIPWLLIPFRRQVINSSFMILIYAGHTICKKKKNISQVSMGVVIKFGDLVYECIKDSYNLELCHLIGTD